MDTDKGYTSKVVFELVPITVRQLHYLGKAGTVAPSIRGYAGSGSKILYSVRDVQLLNVWVALRQVGIDADLAASALREIEATAVLTDIGVHEVVKGMLYCTYDDWTWRGKEATDPIVISIDLDALTEPLMRKLDEYEAEGVK